MSVSEPFFFWSVGEGTAHVPDVQMSLAQSLAIPHFWPSPQRFAAGPPQSTSVSVPFKTPSKSAGTAQAPFAQTSVVQSSRPVQRFPSAHFGLPAPPQSTSVSSPFATPSLVLGAEHRPPRQTPLAQSAPALQLLATPHFGAALPPQSMSDSSPFLTPSVAVALGVSFVEEHASAETNASATTTRDERRPMLIRERSRSLRSAAAICEVADHSTSGARLHRAPSFRRQASFGSTAMRKRCTARRAVYSSSLPRPRPA
jgi:hypothetical protein